MFVNLVRRRRRELGLSQTNLSRLVGVAESTLSDLELGKRQPWPKVRRDLAKALGVRESVLFPAEKEGTHNGRK